MISRRIILSTEYLTEYRAKHFAYMPFSYILGLAGVIYRSRQGNFFDPARRVNANLIGSLTSHSVTSPSFSSLYKTK